jgi:DNA-binding FadR family transcriptional regulator
MRVNGWTDLYDWHIDRASSTPVFRQIYLQTRSAILSQRFSAGTKLPSTRELASTRSSVLRRCCLRTIVRRGLSFGKNRLRHVHFI